MNKNIENAIIIRNKTRLEQLTERFNTQDQAKFYITQSKKAFNFKKAAKLSKGGDVQQAMDDAPEDDFKMYDDEHKRFYGSFEMLQKHLSKVLKFKVIQQDFLPNYIFSEKDVVIVIGQDGLVANTAKYVHGIPIIAVNPDPDRYDGVLLPFNQYTAIPAIESVLSGKYNYEEVTMAETELNDGQKLLAFNDFFIGPTSHTSARYEISFNGYSENHSSSGIIVSTGAGSTGWLSSLFNMANSIHQTFGNIQPLTYQPIPKTENKLVFVVREPFLSKTSQISLTSGVLYTGDELTIESHMPQNGIIFSDGIQSDFLRFNSGAIATIRIAKAKAKLVLP
jgi:NAD kinase